MIGGCVVCVLSWCAFFAYMQGAGHNNMPYAECDRHVARFLDFVSDGDGEDEDDAVEEDDRSSSLSSI